jgi:hypothetical protein
VQSDLRLEQIAHKFVRELLPPYWFKSGRRKQSFFSFNYFADHPNLYLLSPMLALAYAART